MYAAVGQWSRNKKKTRGGTRGGRTKVLSERRCENSSHLRAAQ